MHWLQAAFLSDLEGPRLGVPYDAAAPPPASGTAWWQRAGLALEDLYGIDLRDDAEVSAAAAAALGAAARNLTEFRMRDPLGHGVPNEGRLPTSKGRAFASK